MIGLKITMSCFIIFVLMVCLSKSNGNSHPFVVVTGLLSVLGMMLGLFIAIWV